MPEHYYHKSKAKPKADHRSLNEFASPYPPSPYPGIQGYPDFGAPGGLPGGAPGFAPYYGPEGLAGTAEIIPPVSAAASAAPAAAAAAAAKTGFSLAQLGDLKGLIDRVGGIDGIVNSVGKFQKVMTGMQQIAPMFKLFAGLGKGKTNSSNDGEYRPRRRKKSKKSPSKKKSSSKKSSSKKTSKKKRS